MKRLLLSMLGAVLIILAGCKDPSSTSTVYFTVTFDANGASAGEVPSPVTLAEGSIMVIAGNTGALALDGYYFAGWNTVADGSGKLYSEGAGLSVTSDIILYAQWAENLYTLTYNANGADSGTVPSSVQRAEKGTVTIPGNSGSLLRSGYTFTGWNSESDGTGMTYEEDSTYTFAAGDLTLYAEWEENVILFTGAVQTGGESGVTDSTGLTLSFDADPTTLTREDITLTGAKKGKLSGSGATRSLAIYDIAVADGETISIDIAAPSNYTLNGSPRTAVVYTGPAVTFDYNYDGAESTVETITSGETVARPTVPTRSGYCFRKWYTDASGTVEYDFDSAVTADTTLYAGWLETDDSRIPTISSNGNGTAYVSSSTDFSGACIVPASYDDDRVTSIDEYAFSKDTQITSVEICYGVESICERAFLKCTSLASVEIPDSVTTIGRMSAFYGCTSLTSVTIPDSVTDLGIWTFSGCTSLNSIDFPDTLTTVGVRVLAETALTSFEFSKNIESIGDQAFYNCPKLASVTFESGIELAGLGNSAFDTCKSLTALEIPSGPDSIGVDLVQDCASLGSVTIPDTVTEIKKGSFLRCSKLKNLTIPSGVTTIGETAFKGSSALEWINCEAEDPPALANDAVFDGTNDCPIYVPDDSVSAYQAADYWSEYSTRIKGVSEK